ncbi:MAG: sulfatase, partial [Promethearchaeota archaeon]
MTEKPNIILFITHDQGQFIGCYDSPQTPNSLNTPNLDKLAKEGVRFTNHFCTAPQCSPSRGSIQTSLYPHQHGLMGLVDRGWTLPSNNKTLPIYLKENGYTTHLIGLQHESKDVKILGYDTNTKRKREFSYSCKKMESQYLEFLKEHKNDPKPFYVCIGTWEIHRPFDGWGIPVKPDEVNVPPYLPDHEMIRKDLANYYSAIHILDKSIGKVTNLLNDLSLRENTVICFTTDHGEPFPRAKCTLYDPGIKTALLLSYPNIDDLSNGKIVNHMISNLDLLPTLLDLIGVKIPKSIQGKSFLNYAQEETFRTEIFTEKTFHEYYDPIRSIRTERYKYIINFEKMNNLYQIDLFTAHDSAGKYMENLIKAPRPNEEFYDLKEDPMELNNIVNDSSFRDMILELKNQLFKWMKDTND